MVSEPPVRPRAPSPPTARRPRARWTLAFPLVALLLVPVAALLVARAFAPSFALSGAHAASSTASSSPTAPPAPEERTPEIHGRIFAADGDPVDGAAVRVVSPSPPYAVLRDTKSDGLGRFSFSRVRAGPLRVVADHHPEGVVTSAEIVAAEGQTTEISLVLSAASAVRGTVVDAKGKPVAGAALFVEGVPWIVHSVTSDDAGAFVMTTVPREATFLVAVARGFRKARVALAHRDDQGELVVKVELAAASPVDGDVKDADGNPIRARVVACDSQPSEARTLSAEDGTFQLPASAIGCDAVALHDEYAPSDVAIAVEGHRISLRLKPGGAIEGVVVDERGAAVPSFTLGIESSSALQGRTRRGVGRRGFNDPQGVFRWERLAPGRYVITASAPGKPPARSDSVDVSGGVATTGVRVVLAQGGSVTGHVYDDRHAPIAGVDLRFDAVSSVVDSSAQAKTDDAGLYRLDGAPLGLFTLRVQKEGYRTRLVAGLRVDAHGTLAEDVTLTGFDGGAGLELGGIGAGLSQSRDGVVISTVFPGDPAERVGLRAGDRVLRIDGEETEGMSLADLLQRLRGEVGTTVGVTVLRPSTGETVDVMVVRAVIVR